MRTKSTHPIARSLPTAPAFRGSAAHPLQKLRLEEFYAKVAKAELAPYSLASTAANAKPRALPPLLRPVKPI